jgi:cation:H+ antiporter
VVAFGTSSPELAVNVQAAFSGNSDVGVGNVVGSNIFNVLLILGISAVIVPLTVQQQLVRFDVPLMIGLSVLTYLLALDGSFGRLDGALLFIGLLAYIGFGIWQSRKENQAVQSEYSNEFGTAKNGPKFMVLNVALVVAGLGLLVAGSNWLVEGAVALARLFNVSDLVIGLTVVAIGTSMPEVATSLMAALKKERDIAVGNVVGSNIFNLMGVLGLGSLVAPNGIAVSPSALAFDFPVMIAAAAATLPIFFTGRTITRWEGGLFLVYFAAYTGYLILESIQHHTNRQILESTMLWFVIPFTVIILTATLIQELRTGNGKREAAS